MSLVYTYISSFNIAGHNIYVHRFRICRRTTGRRYSSVNCNRDREFLLYLTQRIVIDRTQQHQQTLFNQVFIIFINLDEIMGKVVYFIVPDFLLL